MPTPSSTKNAEDAATNVYLDRSTLFQLALAVGVAYDAFNRLPDNGTDAAINTIKSLHKNDIDNIQPIWVIKLVGIENRKRLFGYAVTITNVPAPLTSKNILILRGTVTSNESLLSADG
jgi:hypothetical protein